MHSRPQLSTVGDDDALDDLDGLLAALDAAAEPKGAPPHDLPDADAATASLDVAALRQSFAHLAEQQSAPSHPPDVADDACRQMFGDEARVIDLADASDADCGDGDGFEWSETF